VPTRILLADDHLVVRQGLRSLLEHGGFDVVGEAADGHEAIQLAQSVRFDIGVLDICMPRMNGVDAAREILVVAPLCRIVVLTMHAEERQIAAAFHAGVRGYVLKTQAADELIHAISEVAAGRTYLSPHVASVLLAAYLTGSTIGEDPLTSRERQVLQLVAEGKSTKEVADLLGVTAKTAESYRSRLKAKLDIHDTAGLVRYAIRQGLSPMSIAWCWDALSSYLA
jgi:two-component system, NarL family, response regulator NreC